MITIGIEGSANKLGVALLRDTTILSNPRVTFITPPGTGFIPTETMEHHQKNIISLIRRALKEANLKINDINCVAYTKGPGMAAPLGVCALVARVLALKLNVKIKPVNHCVAHIEMGKLVTGSKNPVVLYASGGNTQIITYTKIPNNKNNNKIYGSYKIVGETLDIAIGNCLDRLARILNISNDPSPGYNIEQRAKKGTKYLKIPVNIKGMDISLGGVINYITKNYLMESTTNLNNSKENITKDKGNDKEQVNKKNYYDEELVNNICYSIQEALFSAMVEVTERALSYFRLNEILIVGGVGCNKRLQEMMGIMAKDRNCKVYGMDDRYCIDNGAMIAYTGYLDKNEYDVSECTVSQRWRTDNVEINWGE